MLHCQQRLWWQLTLLVFLSAFKPKGEKIGVYLEHVWSYFKANGIDDNKQVTVLLTVIPMLCREVLWFLQSHGRNHFMSYQRLFAAILTQNSWSLCSNLISTGVWWEYQWIYSRTEMTGNILQIRWPFGTNLKRSSCFSWEYAEVFVVWSKSPTN